MGKYREKLKWVQRHENNSWMIDQKISLNYLIFFPTIVFKAVQFVFSDMKLFHLVIDLKSGQNWAKMKLDTLEFAFYFGVFFYNHETPDISTICFK